MEETYSALRRSPNLNLEIKRLNRLRLMGSLAAGPVLLFITLFTADSTMSDDLLRSGGSLFILGGIALRLWALGSIDGNKKRVLVTWGPYSYLRHPLYCGSFLFVLGFCVLAGSLSAGIVASLAFAGLYVPAMRAEERLLAEQFGGAWEAYCRQTWALIPRMGAQPAGSGRPFRVLRPLREVGVLVLLSLLAFGAAELIQRLHSAHALPDWFL